jgi:hypothetical protein
LIGWGTPLRELFDMMAVFLKGRQESIARLASACALDSAATDWFRRCRSDGGRPALAGGFERLRDRQRLVQRHGATMGE